MAKRVSVLVGIYDKLLKTGIKGNTHMLFQDLNNAELTNVLVKWL